MTSSTSTVTKGSFQDCINRVCAGETVDAISLELGIHSATMSRYLIDYAKQTGQYETYTKAIYNNRRNYKRLAPIAVAHYTKSGKLIKKYPSLAQAHKDLKIDIFKIKLALKEGKEWRYV